MIDPTTFYTLKVQMVATALTLLHILIVNAGVGILVLLPIDHDRKETAKIIAALYALGVFWGLAIHALGVVF